MSTSGQASSSKAAIAWKQDKRGYPERMFPTLILPVDSSSISFTGDGKEPFHRADLTLEEGSDSSITIEAAKAALKDSHLVALPTETVYGLGANALDPDAALKIFKAKGRPVDNPLIVHISDLQMLRRLVPDTYQPSSVYTALMDAFWPGAMTLLFPADEEKVPSVVRCGLKTVGVRLPSHPVARALIAASDLPLAAPSANASGRPSPTSAAHVFRDMTTRKGKEVEGRLPYIIDGGSCQVGVESTVLDGVTDEGELRVLRPGGIGVEDIEKVLKERNLVDGIEGSSSSAVRLRVYGKDMKRNRKEEDHPTTPGMKYRHYSPDAEVVLLVAEKGRALTEAIFGSKDVKAVPLREAINSYTSGHPKAGKETLQVGIMSMDDSQLTSTLFPQGSAPNGHSNGHTYDIRRFSLGSSSNPEEAAQRLFEGLRTLDEGNEVDKRCDVIFVEALNDDAGVGLAIMNRLQKAAGSVLYVK
jgi:L-threonylcarbamoyladenylate synthase